MPEQSRGAGDGPVEVGFGGAVAGGRIVAVANPNSAPIRRAAEQAGKEGRSIDLTCGRRVKAVLFMDSGHVVRLAIGPETLLARWAGAMPPQPSAELGDGA